MITDYEKMKKRTIRAIIENPADIDMLMGPKVRCGDNWSTATVPLHLCACALLLCGVRPQNTAPWRGLVPPAQVRLMALKDELLEIEMEAVEALQDLLQEFDRNYSEIAEGNKGHYNGYFSTVGGP